MSVGGVELEDHGVRLALAELAHELDDLHEAWQEIGRRAVDYAVPYVPVDTGRLADDLHATADRDRVEVAAGGPGLLYAGVQDRGWPARNIAGHHFMDRAEEAIGYDAADVLAEQIQHVIDRLGLD